MSCKCGMLRTPPSADPPPVWTQPDDSACRVTDVPVCALWPRQKLTSWACSLHKEARLVFRVSSRNRKTEPFITLDALHESDET